MVSMQEKQQWLTLDSVCATLSDMARGIERETLRVSLDGRIAQTPHPIALGSALCHNSITTDYSEALLELITQPHSSINGCLKQLNELHSFVHQHLDQELLWPLSMPPQILDEKEIPIGYYGDSLVGTMKHVYRKGLEVRYGRKMQSIAGLHYNISYPDTFWQKFQQQFCTENSLQECKNKAYFGLVRSFLQDSWILTLMTGASPACHTSFVNQKTAIETDLEQVQDYLKATHGCSLRMGGIGYQNAKQSDLFICYDSLEQYVHTLSQALQLPCEEYKAKGLYDAQGHQHQLSTNMLQIENEFYGSIRPKQVAQSLERPSLALERRGVAYVEIRNIDIDPEAPSGISETTAALVEIFVTGCLLKGAKFLTKSDRTQIPVKNNQVATHGRLSHLDYIKGALAHWSSLASIAETLDKANNTTHYTKAFQSGAQRLQNPQTLPSARALSAIKNKKSEASSYTDYALELARQHQHYYANKQLDSVTTMKMNTQAQESIITQEKLPQASNAELNAALEVYFKDLPTYNRNDCASLTD